MTGGLDGKTALVTGASRGIGRAIAIALAADGAEVAVNYNKSPERAYEVVDAIAKGGGSAFAVKADVGQEDEVLSMFEAIGDRLGGLDILINNAGIEMIGPLLESTNQDYDRLMDANLRGVFLCGREAIRRMVEQGRGGRVINISSDLGYLGREDFSLYCASKAAVLALTRSWAKEFAPDILVNAIAPGPIETDMLTPAHMPPEWIEKEKQIPLARLGQPEEVASVALFLAGPGATFVTGQTFGPNGGSVMP